MIRRLSHLLATILCCLFVFACPGQVISAPAAEANSPEAIPEEKLRAAAHQIDVKVAKLFKQRGAEVPENASDSLFLRRSFLLAVGRIPTVEEARVYLESADPEKRQKLVRYLMHSKGYQSHMSNWLSDMLRVRESFENRFTAAPYLAWVRKAVEENKPYDVMVRELLSSQGGLWENGAVGYYIRDKGMPLDNLSNTMRLFLGVRMECAQCHDDPFNDWERMDFFRLAAFTNGQREVNRNPYNVLWKQINQAKQERTELGNLVRFIGDNIYYPTLEGAGKGRIKLPNDYQYRDGKPGELIGARTPSVKSFGKGVKLSDRKDHDDGLQDFAEWVTDPRNEHFVTIITNRMWKRIIGTALFEPVDEYVEPPKNEAVFAELRRYLTGLMQELNYDLRAFQHVLMLTRVYAFTSSDKELYPGEIPTFDGRKISRMSAEQYWDSLVTLAAGNPDTLPTRGFQEAIIYGNKPVLVGELDMKTLQKEILAINSPGELRRYAQNLLNRIKKGGSSKADKMEMDMSMHARRGRGALNGLVRASELPSPAPPGHVLQIFGQSERMLLEQATREANATQVLAMLNGEVEKHVVGNYGAHVYKLSQDGSVQDRIRILFYGILSRAPSEAEMELMQAEVEERGKSGYRNIVSALVNCREFIFVP
jgi:hypothetical protein